MPNLRWQDPFFDDWEGRSTWLTQHLDFYQDHCQRGEETELFACSLITAAYLTKWPQDVARAFCYPYGNRQPRYPEPPGKSIEQVSLLDPVPPRHGGRLISTSQRIKEWLRFRQNLRLEL